MKINEQLTLPFVWLLTLQGDIFISREESWYPAQLLPAKCNVHVVTENGIHVETEALLSPEILHSEPSNGKLIKQNQVLNGTLSGYGDPKLASKTGKSLGKVKFIWLQQRNS